MKNKFYFIYIIFILVILFSSIIVWPNRWINLDIGSLHYHKLWAGPNLGSLTFERLQNRLDIELGRDFEDSLKYKVLIVFQESEINRGYIADDIINRLAKRLEKADVAESDVYWRREEEDYYVYVEVNAAYPNIEELEDIIFSEGDLSIWGERETASEEVNFEENEDPLQSYLRQNYTNLNINANDVKSYSIGETDDSYFIRIALSEDQCKSLSDQIYNYWGSSVIAQLDDQILPIDGQELAKQLEYYKQVKGIKVAGISSRESAQLYGAAIMYGPLSHKLEVISSESVDSLYGRNFLDTMIIAGAGFIILLSILSALFFRKRGVIFTIGIWLFCLLVITSLKLLPVKLTLINIFVFLIGFGLFVYFSLRGMISSIDIKARRIELTEEFLNNLDDKTKIKNLASIILLISLLIEFISIWEIKNINRVSALCLVSIWILYMYILPFLYKFISIAQNDFQKDKL